MTPLAFIFLVWTGKKIGQGHTFSFPCCWNRPVTFIWTLTIDELVIINGQLVVARQHLRAITNTQTWTTAFIVYMFIYLEKFPGKAQEMLRYMHNVRLAAICPTLHMTLLIITLTRTFTPLNTAILTKLYWWFKILVRVHFWQKLTLRVPSDYYPFTLVT